MLRASAASIAVLTLFASAAVARDPSLPAPPLELVRAVKLVEVVRGLTLPVQIAFAPGDSEGRLFVVEQVGRIRVLRQGRLDREPVLDMVGKVSRQTEQGLLGLALHPTFIEDR